jgi:hypothetical protein
MLRDVKMKLAIRALFSLLASFTLLISFPLSVSHAEGNTSRAERGTFKAQAPIAPGVQIVHVGIEPTAVYGVNLADGTWRANFYIWWRWSGDLDPSTTTYFTNNADAAVSQSVKYAYTDADGKPKPLIQANGEKYQYAYIRMGFVEDYQVHRFPLDRQYLTFKIENDTYASNYLVYVFDNKHLSAEKLIPTNGWVSKGVTTSALTHHYTTDFGFIDEGSAFQDYSQLRYSMEIQRDKLFFYLKLLLPLLIVLVATLASLLVRQLSSLSPLAIASTGLLTTLFTKQSYSQSLPPQAPAVLIDKIYLISLFSTLAVFLRVVMRTRKLKPGQAFDNTDLSLFMGSKADFVFAAGLLAFFGLATVFLILL